MARKKSRRKASISQVKAIVKREVGKTRETSKLVSYVGWSRLNDILLSAMPSSVALPNPEQSFCLYSMTGGLDSGINATQDPSVYQPKNLFVLLPSSIDGPAGVANLSGVGQAQQAGTANNMDGSAGVGSQTQNTSIANVHQLEGRACWLKKFYANVCINNSQTSVLVPRNMLVRCVVFQTRRPLSKISLSTQILLQNHGSIAMNATVANAYPTSTLGYLNRDVISKVYYDKVFTLNGGEGATGSLKRFKLKVNINKKCRWSYYYPSRTPSLTNQVLTYQGPYLYVAMWASASSTFDTGFDSVVGIGEQHRPAFTMSTILTFMDD